MLTEREKSYVKKVIEGGVDLSLEKMTSVINSKREADSQVTVNDVAGYVQDIAPQAAPATTDTAKAGQPASTESVNVDRARSLMESEQSFASATRIVAEVLKRLSPKLDDAIRITAPVPKDYCVVSAKFRQSLQSRSRS